MPSTLSITALNKAFGGITVLRDYDLHVSQGTIVALAGPNGCGKTTLLNIICGLERADSGRVELLGTDITGRSTVEICRPDLGLSRQFQRAQLFHNLTVDDNLQLAVRSDDARLRAAFSPWRREAHAADRIDALLASLGLEDLRTRVVGELSYGQQRAVELCRAVLKPHVLLILDEPVAALSAALRARLSSLLIGLKARGDTILMTEHDAAFAKDVANTVVTMKPASTV